MNVADQAPGVIHFGVFEVDLRSGELRKQGMRIRLSGQSFQVLETLLNRPGTLVTREELQRKLWPADSFGDFEHGLNAAVNRVREALGDSAECPRFVETLPRRGYRFIAAVEPRAGDGHYAASAIEKLVSPVAPSDGSGATDTNFGGRKRWLPVLLVAMLIFCVAALAYERWGRRFIRNTQDQTQEDLRVTPLTTLPGLAISPSFSPDGSQVAFGWEGGNSGHPEPFELYVKVVGAEHVEQLTHTPAGFIVPAWSPDGRSIAFIRFSMAGGGIFMIPSRGGPERKLVDSPTPGTYPISLSWSPDSRHLTYSSAGVLHVLTPETGANVEIPLFCKEAYSPAYSPDGATIAFGCYTDDDVTKIYTMPQGGGPAKYLTQVNDPHTPLAWSTDGKRILLTTEGDLWEISKDGGKPRHLLFAQGATQPAISPRGERLAFVKAESRVNIWQVAIDPKAAPSRTVIAPSTRMQRAPDISPDGKRIVFESERSGAHEVWVAGLNGGDAVQLSNFRRLTGTPKWSPDGRQIVFDSRESGEAALYLVDPESAVPRRIPINGLPASVPTWSKDGKWIYFRAGRARSGGLYKVSPQGGDPVLVSPTLGYNIQESSDGRSLYFSSAVLDGEIHVKDVISGEEWPLAGMPHVLCPTEWVLTPTGIFFIDRKGGRGGIGFFEFASAKVTRHISLEKYPMIWGGIAISPDGKSLFVSQVDEEASDLMLVEGFR
jgi:Tol biopolymer transport system component/DNA-binding winged helix-turn-helix (wHTH) protein